MAVGDGFIGKEEEEEEELDSVSDPDPESESDGSLPFPLLIPCAPPPLPSQLLYGMVENG